MSGYLSVTTVHQCVVRLFVACLVAVAAWPAAGQTSQGTVLFRDDFNSTTLNTAAWGLGTWKLGRTQLGNSPVISDGIARLTFDTHRFKGTEIWSKALYSRGNGLDIEARVRLNQLPSGLVTSLFTYNTSGTLADELDIEILSKQVNAYIGSDPVFFTTWNDWSDRTGAYQDGIHHWGFSQTIPGLDVGDWHVFTIRWRPELTEWAIDGVVVASSSIAQPDLPTYVRLNFWAPASSWADAYDAKLKPAPRALTNIRYFYDVDWVEVRRLP